MPCRSSPTAGPGGASRLRAQCWSGSRRALRISGLLAGFGLLIGLAVAPTVAYYGSIDPRVLWEAGGATALFIAGFGAAGYATRRDLTAVARVCFWALLALIVAGIVLIFVHIPGADLAYSVLGVPANGSGPAVLLLARALTPIEGLTMRIRKHPADPPRGRYCRPARRRRRYRLPRRGPLPEVPPRRQHWEGRDNLTTRLPGLPAAPFRPQRLEQPVRSMAQEQNLARTHASHETTLTGITRSARTPAMPRPMPQPPRTAAMCAACASD